MLCCLTLAIVLVMQKCRNSRAAMARHTHKKRRKNKAKLGEKRRRAARECFSHKKKHIKQQEKTFFCFASSAKAETKVDYIAVEKNER